MRERTTSFNGRELVGKVSSEAGAPFQSLLLGVGHWVRADTASISVPPSRAFDGVTSPPWSPNDDDGVGHWRSDSLTALPSSFPDGPLLLPSWLEPCGVGHDPNPVPAVRSANGGSGYTMPFRIVADRSERPEHRVQSASAKS
jgi:hypothetical protein